MHHKYVDVSFTEENAKARAELHSEIIDALATRLHVMVRQKPGVDHEHLFEGVERWLTYCRFSTYLPTVDYPIGKYAIRKVDLGEVEPVVFGFGVKL
jgi:hypothetical protein